MTTTVGATLNTSKFRKVTIRPRQDFLESIAVAEIAGLEAADPGKFLLFDYPAIVVILDAANNIAWPETLFLVEVARRSRSMTGDTVRTYSESLLALLNYLSEIGLAPGDVTEERWGAYCQSLCYGKKKYAIATTNLHLTVAANFLVWGQTSGVLSSPFGKYLQEMRQKGIPLMIAGRRVRLGTQATQLRYIKKYPRFISIDDFQRLARSAPLPYRLQFKWAICTGIRRFEICSLTIGNLDESTISSCDGLVQLELVRKGGYLRSIYVPSDLIEETRWYVRMDRPKPKRHADDTLFLSPNGFPMSRSGLTRKFHELAVRLGIKCTLHNLRHTFALHVLERLQKHELAGDSINAIKVVQVLLGHSSIATTEIYLDAMEITSDAVSESLGYLYGASL